MEKLKDKIRQLDWPELEIEETITLTGTDIILLSVDKKNTAKLLLLYRRVNEDGSIEFLSSHPTITQIHFPVTFHAEDILTKELKLRYYQRLSEVFDFKSSNITTIKITDDIDTFEIKSRENVLKINPDVFKEIIKSYDKIYEESNSYASKLVTYRVNEFQRSYFGIERERKTTTSKGEFRFMVDRFNLPTKVNKADFGRYLNERDIDALQELTLKLIQKEVFGENFLTKLNDYFIKVRLEDIIRLGRQILNLKSPSLKTTGAKKVVGQIESDARKIKQMETLWQKYFEKYLSFLIFSYQKLYPKIELNVQTSKKYPDFIGINHFGGVDIIEIKTHLKSVVTKDSSHDNYAFSSEMSKSIIQTINYMDALIQEKIKNKKERDDIKGKILEGNIYRPRGIIIISSSDKLANGVKRGTTEFSKVERDFTKLRHGLHNIQILTFDELLDMADTYKNNITT